MHSTGNQLFDQDFEDKLTVTAKLADGNDLPSWLTFVPATWTFEARPSEIEGFDVNDPKFAGQNWEIKVTATDLQGASVSTTFTLTLTEGELYVQGTDTADSWVGVRRRQRFDGEASRLVRLIPSAMPPLLLRSTSISSAQSKSAHWITARAAAETRKVTSITRSRSSSALLSMTR
ncbi:putative Ig domain-containing protein [Hankyongella ginsenosidimutans]|uniref:putative Ig domain-containing protein n=1 Tax=Hankyongella ginsenosidimutans TaxID=1763828 RepID=UPI003CCC7853